MMGKINSKEVWKPIEGYEGYYEVSNLGRVKSLERTARFVSVNGKECRRRVRERIITGTEHCTQHRITVMLTRENDKKRWSVHRLVAKAFCENPNGYTEVNHIDENPRNNSADNLEWCTRHYNMHYGTIKERVYDKNRKPILAIDSNGDTIRFSSFKIAERLGFQRSSIHYAMDNDQAYKGLFWGYEENEQ